MANYTREIQNMMDRLIYRILIVDKKGLKAGKKGDVLSGFDIYMLKKIGEDDEKKLYELIEEMEADRGLIASSLKKLMAYGFVEKEKSPTDKRAFILRLTEEGKQVYEEKKAEQQQLLDLVLADITLNEEKAVLKFLSRMNQATKSAGKTIE
ncbi:MAG: MarR family winged helix-turn-helix transcriptional regulator [Bacillota bacterium]